MSTTVTYKGSTLTTATNQTKVLETAGKYMEDDVTIVDVTATPSLQSKTKSYTPTETTQRETVTADSGYTGLSQVSVTVNSIAPMYVGSGVPRRSSVISQETPQGWAVTTEDGYYASDIDTVIPKATWENPRNVTITPRINVDNDGLITASVSAAGGVSPLTSGYTPSGLAFSQIITGSATKQIASGTEGTPTATKSTVSNHSVSVTPSVTNTGGYITGGTKTGTAVTVTASELVSGSDTVTTNDTYDVTNLAELIVNVSGGGVTVTDVANTTGTTCVITTGSAPSETWETVYRNSVGWWTSVDDDYPYCWITDATLVQIQPSIGSVWRVTFDDEIFRLTAKAASSALPIGLGNPKYVGGTDDGSDAPFCIGPYGYNAWSGNADVIEETNHFLKIERLVTT